MVYDTVSNNAKFYLGNNLVESANHQLVLVPGDAFVNNYYPSGGYPLKGNWRNLRIYGKKMYQHWKTNLPGKSSHCFPQSC
jgi:hypothetical protein